VSDAIEELRRYVSEYFVRKDVLEQRLGRMEDKIDRVSGNVTSLQEETKARSATWKGAVIAIVVGVLVGVVVSLLVKGLG